MNYILALPIDTHTHTHIRGATIRSKPYVDSNIYSNIADIVSVYYLCIFVLCVFILLLFACLFLWVRCFCVFCLNLFCMIYVGFCLCLLWVFFGGF